MESIPTSKRPAPRAMTDSYWRGFRLWGVVLRAGDRDPRSSPRDRTIPHPPAWAERVRRSPAGRCICRSIRIESAHWDHPSRCTRMTNRTPAAQYSSIVPRDSRNRSHTWWAPLGLPGAKLEPSRRILRSSQQPLRLVSSVARRGLPSTEAPTGPCVAVVASTRQDYHRSSGGSALRAGSCSRNAQTTGARPRSGTKGDVCRHAAAAGRPNRRTDSTMLTRVRNATCRFMISP